MKQARKPQWHLSIIAFLMCGLLLMGDMLTAEAKVSYLPYVTAAMSRPSFWTAKQKKPSDLLLKQNEIDMLNRDILAENSVTHLIDLKNLPETINGVTVSNAMKAATQENADYYLSSTHYDADGNPVDASYYAPMIENAENPDALESQPAMYGIAVNRTNILTMPTDKAILDDPGDNDFDNLYDSSINVNDPVYIRSVSKDRQYYAVYVSDCTGWVRAEDIAICSSRSEWISAWDLLPKNTLVVYDGKIRTESSITHPEVSQKMLSMGTTLELADENDWDGLISNRSAYHNHVVYMPVKREDGSYAKELCLISENRNVSEGYLPLTTENIAMVAFNMLGDCYGWGGMLSSADCSSYIRDIYRCFGLRFARNTTWQKSMPVKQYDFTSLTDQQKMGLLDNMPLGTTLFFPGHTMMYLGKDNGNYYVISSTSSIMNPDESKGRLRARDVLINTLDLKRANGNTWLKSLTAASIPYIGKRDSRYNTDYHPAAVIKVDGKAITAAKTYTVKKTAINKKAKTYTISTDSTGALTFKNKTSKAALKKYLTFNKTGKKITLKKSAPAGVYKYTITVAADSDHRKTESKVITIKVTK